MTAGPVVVITGSTRGIGFGLARAFLDRGCRVVISGREVAALTQARRDLGAEDSRVIGQTCDVRSAADLAALWAAAVAQFGQVDLWVHNAGMARRSMPVSELSDSDIDDVIGTNLTGSFLSARVALDGFQRQGHGKLFLMQGLGGGKTGPVMRGTALYGASKAGVWYLTQVLAKEARGSGVLVGALGPGIVATDMVIQGDLNHLPKRDLAFIDQFGDRVETVAPFLADAMLRCRKQGAFLNWLSPWRLAGRMLIWPFYKRRVFSRLPLRRHGP